MKTIYTKKNVICVYIVYCLEFIFPLDIYFFTHLNTSPLPVKGCKFF